METAKLTLQLPKQDVEFAEQYARARRITLTDLIDRYLEQNAPGLMSKWQRNKEIAAREE